uniref:Testis expressed basic protein 1 n=1 Tax=Myotis myotis TaxID=51298 RepID=A0A7J7RL36_MYOMY|nr:testis expressed basic protein 1 [Myotis myotis]
MAVLEITLAVILTLLGLAILAILLTRWTRRKQNEMDVSRYNSEQSASLLDYEHGRGLRHSYSTESDTSYDDLQGSRGGCTPSANSPVAYANEILPGNTDLILILFVFSAPSRASIGDTKSLKATPGLFSSTAGAIMQFSAPIPGATGPIKLTQKTIVQSPGPIVQYAGSSGQPLAPITISQRTSIDDSGKITLSPMVIFPGYMDGELAKKSDPRVSILKTGGTAKSKRSEDKNKEALKKEISFTGSEESLVHKTKSERKAKDTDLDTGKIDMEAKVKGSDMGMPRREEAQVKASEAGIPQGQASQEKENEVEIPQGQATQEKENEVEIPQGQATQEKENEVEIPQGQAASQEKEGEVEIPQGPESQVKKSEAKTPKGPKAKVKKSEAGTPQGQKPQENTESSEAKGNQVKEKEDAGKTEDTKETDAKDKKSGEGKDQVKGKKEPQVKRKKAEAKKETGN